VLTVYTVPDSFPYNDVKKHLSAPFRNAIFREIIATERCCFAQLLKVVHSVSDRCFFAPLRKAIRYSGNAALAYSYNTCNSELDLVFWKAAWREVGHAVTGNHLKGKRMRAKTGDVCWKI
jgi:hypothetical protein